MLRGGGVGGWEVGRDEDVNSDGGIFTLTVTAWFVQACLDELGC